MRTRRQRMTPDGGVVQHVGVEGIHRRAPCSGVGATSPDLGEEGLGAFRPQCRLRSEGAPTTLVEQVTHRRRHLERLSCAAHPEGVGTHNHRYCRSVARDGDLLAGADPIEDARQGRPGLADRHRRAHGRNGTRVSGRGRGGRRRPARSRRPQVPRGGAPGAAGRAGRPSDRGARAPCAA